MNKESIRNFLSQKNSLNIPNKGRLSYLFLYLLALPAMWKNFHIVEKIVYLGIGYVYLFFALLYANETNMKDRIKKNRFYGWTMYLLSCVMLFDCYRFLFKGFHWTFIVMIAFFIIQSLLWILSLKRNVKLNKYSPQINLLKKEFMGFSLYTALYLGVLVAFLAVFIGYYYFVLQNKVKNHLIYLANCFCIISSVFMSGLTFIYQNVLIKKYNLHYLVDD